MEINDTEKTMTPYELADYFRISSRTVYRMVQKREIPFIKIRGRVRFRDEDIEQYLKSARVEVMKK